MNIFLQEPFFYINWHLEIYIFPGRNIFYSGYLLQELTPSKLFVLIFCFNLFLPSKCPSHELIPTKRFLHSHYPSQTLSSQSVSCRELFPTFFSLSKKHPAENYSLQFFSFPGSILQRTIPYNFFPFQEVSCRELFPTFFFLSRKYPSENYSLQNLSFPGSILQRTIPNMFFPFKEASCRELFPTKSFLSRKYPAENYSLHNFSFPGSIFQRTIPYNFFSFPGSILQRTIPYKICPFPGSILQRNIPYFFPFQEVSCREIFPKQISFGSIKHTKKSNFTSYRFFFSLILAYV